MTKIASVASRICMERRRLYSNWMIRIKRSVVETEDLLDFAPGGGTGRLMLEEDDSDSILLRSALKTAIQYVEYDKEVILLRTPKEEDVEIWSQKERLWYSLAAYAAAKGVPFLAPVDLKAAVPKASLTCHDRMILRR